MSQKCPNCGLLNPTDAGRCDCGYDFVSKTVESSYALAHAIEKHGGEASIIESASCSKIQIGLILLALAAIVTVGSLLAGGRVYFWGGAAMWGALHLYRGLRQRRQRSLDDATRTELIHRS